MKRFTLLCLLLFSLPCLAIEKSVYGLNEYARLPEIDLELPAKLDTGARTASLSARDIDYFQRGDEQWVRFYLAIDQAHAHPIERPLVRVGKIKRRADDVGATPEQQYSARPVIRLDVCLGKDLHSLEVNLTDRSAFQYPLLIGADALKRFNALVDPSLKYAAGKPACSDNIAQNAE
ncbi:ATP-dependent zinc protease [Pseudomonas sp. Leaf127]|uniref:retropepsin-like aspartic peptidase RloA n=1 Tax=Pseudomonas TaxID=286 RepID=UPI0007036A14|nr:MULTISPECIES: ATP-dependent zinc protease [Pseudomonas]KQQ60066.1 ATP-dependent zinc protease [Pseudomonas sp. Leaf127]